MEILFEILEECIDDIIELIYPLLKRFFGFIRKTLIPWIALSIKDARHNVRLKRFNNELDVKAENTLDDKSYFDEKQ